MLIKAGSRFFLWFLGQYIRIPTRNSV
jgi:hypothetical protein